MRAWNAPVIAVLALLVVPSAARAAESRMVLRGGACWIRPSGEWSGDLLISEGANVARLEADGSIGPQLSLEYTFTRLIGGEVSVLQGSHDIKGSGLNFPEAKFGHVRGWPILFGANFHLTRNSKFDFYLGPVIGWVIWGDLNPSGAAQQFVDIGKIRMHDGFAWGVNAGVDVPFARHWAFSFDLRELDYSAKTDSGPIKAVLGEDAKIPIKPLVATAGLGLRW